MFVAPYSKHVPPSPRCMHRVQTTELMPVCRILAAVARSARHASWDFHNSSHMLRQYHKSDQSLGTKCQGTCLCNFGIRIRHVLSLGSEHALRDRPPVLQQDT